MNTELSNFRILIRAIFRGMGQVMFQNNAWSGLLILIGVFTGSWISGLPQVGFGAIVGCLASTLAGMLIGKHASDGVNGLWGFNGMLVGCAFPTFLDDTWLMWLALVICAMSTTWVRRGFNNVMAPWKVNSLTFPFVFMTLIFLLTSKTLGALPEFGLSAPTLDASVVEAARHPSFGHLVEYWLKGISQVFLVNSWIAGIIILVALGVNSLWAALWAAVASAICIGMGYLFKADASDIANGLYCFSPVLTGVALGMTFYKPNWHSALWCLAGIIVTFFVQAGMNSMMEPFGLPTLTGPFCIATWLFLLPRYKMDARDTPDHSDWPINAKKGPETSLDMDRNASAFQKS